MYQIIVGAGRIGSSYIEMAVEDGNDVVVIEKNHEVANEISGEYDCLVLNANATDRSVLEEAGIERADALVSTTDDDAVNTMVMLLGQEYAVPSLVSVVRDPGHLPVFEKIGVNVVENPQNLIADYLYHSVRYPGVKDFMTLGDDSEFVELNVTETAPIVGQTLSTARKAGTLPSGSLVAALRRNNEVVTPSGETTVEAGDTVTVLVNDAGVDEVLEAFGHETNGH